MKRSRWIFAPAAILLIGLGCTLLWWGTREIQPVYGGKPILAYFPEWQRNAQQQRGPRPPGAPAPAPWVPGARPMPIGELYTAKLEAESIDWLMRVIRRNDSMLKRFYLKHEKSLPASIRKVLPDPIPASYNRERAAQLLQSILFRDLDAALPKLIDALQLGNRFERVAAANAIANFGPRQTPASVPSSLDRSLEQVQSALVANLTHNSSEVQVAAFQALLGMVTLADESFSAMATWWSGNQAVVTNPSVAERFSRVVARNGSRARATLPIVQMLRTNSNPMVRIEASFAVWRIDPSDTVCGEVLLQALSGITTPGIGSSSARLAASYLVQYGGSMHLQPESIVPPMIEILRKTDFTSRTAFVQAQAAGILSQFSTNALPVLPELVRALSHPDRELRFQCARAIEALGPAASNAIPALIKSLDDPACQSVAARALGAFGPDAAAAVPRLTEIVSDTARVAGSRELRVNAAYALSQLGRMNPPVVAALRTAADDPDPEIRAAAAEALQRITIE